MFNLRGFDLNLLTVFEAIYEAGTVSRAAERLALSQAATGHALGRLRDVCGDELFVRAGPQVRAHTGGSGALRERPEGARRIARRADGSPRLRSGDMRREFNIAIPHPLRVIHRRGCGFRWRTPHLRIVLRTDTKTMPADFTSDLREGRLDFAIDWTRVEHDRFINKVILSEELMLVVRRDHPRIGSAPTLDEVMREDFVWLHPRRPREERPKAILELEGLGLRRVLLVSEWLEIPTLVSLFDLLSIVPKSLSRMLVGHLGVNIAPIPASIPRVPIFAVWHEARCHDPAHQWLRKVVAEELRRQVDV